MDFVEKCINESIMVKKEMVKNSETIKKIADAIMDCFKKGNKVLLCGNGGSAADSQHIAAELVNKFRLDRNPLPAIALTTDTSILTSISNDYGFEQIFEKQVEAIGRKNDILLGITTSGESGNVIRAIKKAKDMGLKTIAFTGSKGIPTETDMCLKVRSQETPRVQEAHITVLHIVCDLVEKGLFGK